MAGVLLGAVQGEAARVFGIDLVGVSPANGRKLLLTLALIVGVLVAKAVLHLLTRWALRPWAGERARFWSDQVIRLLAAAIIVLGVLSIWFESPGRLASVLGLIGAGVAVALQRVVTSFAAYLIILRGRLFTVGDRIVMGGVRGDVIALGFMQTTVMEMGQTPAEQGDAPSQWVHARQYTGRIVRITNDRIFDAPVYNYTREFPYMWEEMRLPVPYDADHARAERILLDAARRHTAHIRERSEPALRALARHYALKETTGVEPHVYWRLTDNWLELTVRFVAEETGVRALKDAMSREILAELRSAGIEIASTTVELVGVPPLHIEHDEQRPHRPPAGDSSQPRAEAPRAE